MEKQLFSILIQELQSLRAEVTDLKIISIKQNELLERLSRINIEEMVVENVYQPPIENQGIDHKISSLLQELNIPANLKGYVMLREAVKLVYHNFDMLGGITKELYPLIADRFNTTPTRAERVIRHAIEVSWSRANDHVLYARGYRVNKPTNAQFIALLADKLLLEEAIS